MLNRLLVPLFLMAIFSNVSARAELIDVNNTQLSELLDNNVTIVDVRRSDEWEDTGIIAGSVLMTFFNRFGSYNAENWLEKFYGVSNKKSPVILICHSGVRSRIIGNWLSKSVGYEKVYNVSDGIDSWIKSGRAIVTATTDSAG